MTSRDGRDITSPSEPYSRLRADLTRAVRRICPSWLADRADDLVQTAMLRVMEVERRSEGNRAFNTSYLYRAAYCSLIDEIRRLRRRGEVPLDDQPGEAMAGSSIFDPERRSAAREIGRGIQECLAAMIRPRRLAVTLHLQGHTVPESSRLLGWGAKRTENLVYRGLADLRQCLAAKGLAP